MEEGNSPTSSLEADPQSLGRALDICLTTCTSTSSNRRVAKTRKNHRSPSIKESLVLAPKDISQKMKETIPFTNEIFLTNF